MVLVKSGKKSRCLYNPNVTESFTGWEAGQPRGYQRNEWERSAALITAAPVGAPARPADVGQQLAGDDLQLLTPPVPAGRLEARTTWRPFLIQASGGDWDGRLLLLKCSSGSRHLRRSAPAPSGR